MKTQDTKTHLGWRGKRSAGVHEHKKEIIDIFMSLDNLPIKRLNFLTK